MPQEAHPYVPPDTWLVEVTDDCVSSMQCVMTAPDLFALNDDGFSFALHPEVSADRSEDVRRAVDGCPMGAIRAQPR